MVRIKKVFACNAELATNKVIEKDGRWFVHSEEGKNLGHATGYDTKEEADKRLGEIEYFKHQSNMEIICNLAITSITSDDKYYYINRIPITVDDAVMNGVHYSKAENAKGMPNMVGKPITLSHPKDKGNLTTITGNGKAMSDYFSGGHVTKVYNEQGVWYCNAEIKKSILSAQDDGQEYIEALESKKNIGVSTGLLFESNNESGYNKKGEKYSVTAKGQEFDHLALLLHERPAGGDSTVMKFNAEDNVFVLDNILNSEEESLFNRLLTKFAKATGINVKSTEQANQTEADPMKDKILEALKKAGVKVEDMSDDDMFDEYNAMMKKGDKKPEKGITKEEVANMLSEAFKANKEIATNAAKSELVEKVIATNEKFTESDKEELLATPEKMLQSLVVNKAAPLSGVLGRGLNSDDKCLQNYEYPS